VVWLPVDGDGLAGVWRRLLTALTGAGALTPSDVDRLATEADPRALRDTLPAAEGPVLVVLDDVHRLPEADARVIVERLAYAANGRLRLVLGCRTDPPLPLHRWRVNGDLGELRTPHLAFTVSETDSLLNHHDVRLTESAVAELHAVTEGWPAGLRLAALGMCGHPEPERVVDDLGTDDLVADYLAAEVLGELPADTQDMLVLASVAEQVTASLVEALTGREDGARILDNLQRRGAFVRRCEGAGDWYRFHPLLSRLLYAQLRRRDPQRLLRAHRLAAHWYGAHGQATEALRHLLAAEDWSAAVDVVERHWPDVVVGSRRRSLKEIVASPPDLIRTEPRLALAFAAERLDVGDPVRLRRFLRLAVGRTGEAGHHVPAERRPPAAMVTAFQLAEARLNGDLHRILELAPQLLGARPGEVTANGNGTRDEPRALGLIGLGTAQLHLGRLDEAGAALGEGLALAGQLDLGQAQLCAGSHLALLQATRGRLRAAARTGRETLVLAGRLGLMHTSDLGWVRLALAETQYQWDRQDEARQLVEQALDQSYGDAQMLIAGSVLQAKVRFALGEIAEAYQILLTARHEAAYTDVPGPQRRALALVEAELRLAGGDAAAARRRLSSWHEEEPFPAWAAAVEASILLAEGKAAAAATMLTPFLAGPGAGSSLTWTAQAGLLTALAGQALGDRDRVTRGLDVALEAAEEEGFRRLFVAGGHAVRELISAFAPGLAVYRLVVADLAEPPDPLAATQPGWPAGAVPRVRRIGSLVDPLTERELTVLRYLQGTLSNVEIASMLYVSVNTVKTHVKNIYRKLNAGHRREAVRRARELRLL
jgi:LuxR family maltose regulon positive regulatory protein